MTINIGLALGLIMSIIINLFAFWYIRGILGRLTWFSENINDLEQIIKIYSNNLERVYELEQFYGDQEIKTLVAHTVSLLDVLEEYKEVALATEPIEYLEEDESETQPPQEQPNAEKEV
jgi:hypothetical protein